MGTVPNDSDDKGWARRVREQLGLSLPEMAAVLGMHREAYRKWDAAEEPVQAAPAVRLLADLDAGRAVITRDATGRAVGWQPVALTPDMQAHAWRTAYRQLVARAQAFADLAQLWHDDRLRLEREGGEVARGVWEDGAKAAEREVNGLALEKRASVELTTLPTSEYGHPVSREALTIAAERAKPPRKHGVQLNHLVTPELKARLSAAAERAGLREADMLRAVLWLHLPDVEGPAEE